MITHSWGSFIDMFYAIFLLVLLSVVVSKLRKWYERRRAARSGRYSAGELLPFLPPRKSRTRLMALTEPPAHPVYAGEGKAIYTPVATDISLDHDDATIDREMTDMSSTRAGAVEL